MKIKHSPWWERTHRRDHSQTLVALKHDSVRGTRCETKKVILTIITSLLSKSLMLSILIQNLYNKITEEKSRI